MPQSQHDELGSHVNGRRPRTRGNVLSFEEIKENTSDDESNRVINCRVCIKHRKKPQCTVNTPDPSMNPST